MLNEATSTRRPVQGEKAQIAVRRVASPAGPARPAGARQPYRARLDARLCQKRRGGSRLTDGVPQAETLMEPLPVGQRTHRPGKRVPALAFPPCDDGGTHHPLQTQNRQRQLLAQDRAVRSQPSRRIARRAIAGRVRVLGRLVWLDWMRFPDDWKLRTDL